MIDYKSEVLLALAQHAVETDDAPAWRAMETYADPLTIKSHRRTPGLHQRAIARAARALVAEGWCEQWPEADRWRLRAQYRDTAVEFEQRSGTR